MARLNISIPDKLYLATNKWRGRVNLSEICAKALQRELEALEFHRTLGTLTSSFRSHTTLESQLLSHLGLADTVVLESPMDHTNIREELGKLAANYLDRHLCDDSLLAIAGGRQMWCVVKNLTPKSVSVTVTGLGIDQSDPQVLHAHANTLTTLLWLLFSPRAQALVVGRNELELHKIWRLDLPLTNHPRYFVIGSCGPFEPGCSLAGLLGTDASEVLFKRQVCGDFLYQFFDDNGEIVDASLRQNKSILSSDILGKLCKRPDARVILVAGGPEKLKIIYFALRAGLFNVLITDKETARGLLSAAEQTADNSKEGRI